MRDRIRKRIQPQHQTGPEYQDVKVASEESDSDDGESQFYALDEFRDEDVISPNTYLPQGNTLPEYDD